MSSEDGFALRLKPLSSPPGPGKADGNAEIAEKKDSLMHMVT